MNISNPLQTGPVIGNDYYYAVSVIPNVHNQDTGACLFTIDRIAKPLPYAAQTLEDQHFEEPESQQPFLDWLTLFWYRDICLYAWQLGEYSNKAHLSAVMAAIEHSDTLLQSQDDKVLDIEPSDDDNEYSCLQNPTKAPIIWKEFLRNFPFYPIIYWASQMCNNPKLCFCPFSIHSSPWRENNKIFIHDDHGCKAGAMTSQELLRHLKDEVDSTHTAIPIYLETLNTLSRGHVRQDFSVNS
jgi:hypothetical protein